LARSFVQSLQLPVVSELNIRILKKTEKQWKTPDYFQKRTPPKIYDFLLLRMTTKYPLAWSELNLRAIRELYREEAVGEGELSEICLFSMKTVCCLMKKGRRFPIW